MSSAAAQRGRSDQQGPPEVQRRAAIHHPGAAAALERAGPSWAALYGRGTSDEGVQMQVDGTRT